MAPCNNQQSSSNARKMNKDNSIQTGYPCSFNYPSAPPLTEASKHGVLPITPVPTFQAYPSLPTGGGIMDKQQQQHEEKQQRDLALLRASGNNHEAILHSTNNNNKINNSLMIRMSNGANETDHRFRDDDDDEYRKKMYGFRYDEKKRFHHQYKEQEQQQRLPFLSTNNSQQHHKKLSEPPPHPHPPPFNDEYINFNNYSRRQNICICVQLMFILLMNGLQLGKVISHSNANNKYTTKAVAMSLLKNRQFPVGVNRIYEITTGFIAASMIMSIICILLLVYTIRSDIRFRAIQTRLNKFSRLTGYLIGIIGLTNIVTCCLTYFALGP